MLVQEFWPMPSSFKDGDRCCHHYLQQQRLPRKTEGSLGDNVLGQKILHVEVTYGLLLSCHWLNQTLWPHPPSREKRVGYSWGVESLTTPHRTWDWPRLGVGWKEKKAPTHPRQGEERLSPTWGCHLTLLVVSLVGKKHQVPITAFVNSGRSSLSPSQKALLSLSLKCLPQDLSDLTGLTSLFLWQCHAGWDTIVP